MRKTLLATITVAVSTIVALIIGESFLVVYSSSKMGQEDMDPGVIQYHSRYGWNLSSNWQGDHSHPDYEVTYHVDHLGFRHTGKQGPDTDNSPLTLIVGDSFTFGLGVEDTDTYVAQLQAINAGKRYINAAVPGYSPEQALLKAEDLVGIYRPEALMFVVYLGNDLVDIGLPFPVQAEFAKPYAVMEDGHWQLVNLPVPRVLKPEDARARTLASYTIEPGTESWLAGFKLGQLLLENGVVPNPAALNRDEITASLVLFEGILDRLLMLHDVDITLVLLPGSSAQNRPDSLAARYQRQINDELIRLAASKPIKTLPLLESLGQVSGTLYYPLDGHLIPEGHRLVARQIAAAGL